MFLHNCQLLIDMFLKYMFFALISTIANVLAQYVSFNLLWSHDQLFNGIVLGTVTGFLIKYILDKIYIFHFRTKNILTEIKVFSSYTFMSILTTLLFWFTEYMFELFIDIKHSRYIGAIVGLSIGYTIKFFLDKNYVFSK